MASLTRDQISALRTALPTTTVEVPELGGSVTIRTLTLKEVGEIQRRQKQYAGEPLRLYPDLLKKACVDDAGNPLFAGGDDDLIDALPWPAVDALAVEVLRFNKMAGAGEGEGPKV